MSCKDVVSCEFGIKRQKLIKAGEKMNAWIVFQRMLVLFAMMMTGFFSYKKGILDEGSLSKLSKLVVSIMNPLLIIDGVIGKDSTGGSTPLKQNILMMILYYCILLIISFPVSKILRVKKGESFLYRLMMIFSNVGFMGIPVITSLYGDGCVLYIAFYILGYNLILYTYGLYLVDSSISATDDNKNTGSKKSFTDSLTKIFNSGVLACIIAILIFALNIKVPGPVSQFISGLGSCAVPLSMVLIGASMAQQRPKDLFSDKKIYLFLSLRMLLVPITAALILKQVMRFIPLDTQVAGVFGLMLAMPVGSIVVLLAKDRGGNEKVCTAASVVSTLASVITIPIIAAFLP